jgi:hypothetical protein
VDIDLGHVFPRNSDASASADPRRDTSDETGARTPDIRAAQDRDDLELLSRSTLERQIVDLATAAILRVDQLPVDDAESEVDRVAQFWPTFVRISNGTAVREMITITTR